VHPPTTIEGGEPEDTDRDTSPTGEAIEQDDEGLEE